MKGKARMRLNRNSLNAMIATGLALAALVGTGACASEGHAQAAPSLAPEPGLQATSGATTGTPAAPTFADWLEGFKAEARAAGIRDDILETAFVGVAPHPRVYELQDNQPEFAKGIWTYLDSAVSDTRVANGRAKFAENRILLELVGDAYGVDPAIIAAIWGLESAYGAVMGDYDTIRVLSSIAYKGRRTAFGRSQLMGALNIIQNGYADRNALKGSWAGAMGHTQFIPTTYLAYAVDHDGDGRRDIWTNLGDVFASTANYLAASGYRKDRPAALEVVLPDNFDYAVTDTLRRALVEWSASGIVAADAEPLIGQYDPNLRGRIIVPAGASGPAFMVFENFDAILKYNRSTSYALAVSLLGQKIAGRGGDVVQPWPRGDRPLSLSERKELQQTLKDRGFDPGPVDGIIGAGTKRALRRWQISVGIPADGYASATLLTRLRG